MYTELTRDQKLHKQVSDNNALKEEQKRIANGERDADTIPANIDDTRKINKLEENYVHVLLINKMHNENTKSYENVEKVDLYHSRDFEQLVNSGAFNLFDEVRVIHHPEKKEYTQAQLKPNSLDVTKTKLPEPAGTSLKEKQLAKQKAELEQTTKQRDEDWKSAQESIQKEREQLKKDQEELQALLAEARKNKAQAPATTPVIPPAEETTETGAAETKPNKKGTAQA